MDEAHTAPPNHETAYPPLWMSWLIWGLGALFYLSGFYQRVAPAVMTDQLMADFGIGATSMGHLSAFYFYSYVGMQIPTGILADVLGPKRLLTMGALVAAVGAFFFAAAPGLGIASLGRFLIGGAVGVAWVSLLMLSSRWFPHRQYALTSGLGLCTGLVGAVSAGVPLRLLVEAFGWRPVMLVSACVSVGIFAAIALLVRDDPSQKGYAGYIHTPVGSSGKGLSILQGALKVFRYPNTWFLTLAPGGVVGPVLAFSGLWGVPFFSTVYGLTPAKSAALCSAMLVSWGVGGPVFGGLSDRIGRRKPLYLAGCALGCAGWAVILFVPGLPLGLLSGLVLGVGFVSGGMIIGFAFVRESVPPSLAGTVSGVCNMGVMIGPMVLQPAMGKVLDLHWQGELMNGVRVYSGEAYRAAFMLMIAWSLFSVLMMLFTRETHCRPMATLSNDA
ncbi:MAG: MFS transporter [Desulfobacteraceae bacterium]|jgi:MFS family permease